MPTFYNSTAAFPMKTRQSLYARDGRVSAKSGIKKLWHYLLIFPDFLAALPNLP